MRRKFFAYVDGGRVEGLACADPGTRTPSAWAEIDPLLNHFVYFQEPDKTKNIQSNEKSVTFRRKGNPTHSHLNQRLPIILSDPGSSYGAYFEEPDIHWRAWQYVYWCRNIPQMYKKRRRRRSCPQYWYKTNTVLSFDWWFYKRDFWFWLSYLLRK